MVSVAEARRMPRRRGLFGGGASAGARRLLQLGSSDALEAADDAMEAEEAALEEAAMEEEALEEALVREAESPQPAQPTWRSWLLDRPPPWERDCDCCFESCPPGRNCLAQADSLFLACRGDSVGMILDRCVSSQGPCPATPCAPCTAAL